MKFENTDVWGFEHAMRGMRNPKNSWDKNDTGWYEDTEENESKCNYKCYAINPEQSMFAAIGPNDLKLAQSLIKAGPEHRKFLRQIMVSVDITAPLFWFLEFDTYKVGTVSNSTSKMHTIANHPITLECFETDDYKPELSLGHSEIDTVEWDVNGYIQFLEKLRQLYLQAVEKSKNDGLVRAEKKLYENRAKQYWKELIRWLPESWLQKRTITMNYENLLGMCSKGQRRYHKLTEWSKSFIEWTRGLPYADEFLFFDESNNTNEH